VQFTCNLFGVDNSCFPIYANKIEINDLDSHVFFKERFKLLNGFLPDYLIDNCDLALGIFGNTDKARNAVPNKLIKPFQWGYRL